MRISVHIAGPLAAALLLAVAGCAGTGDVVTGSVTDIPPSDQRPSDKGVAQGQRHYSVGDYGLAEREFRGAVESNPRSVDAWLGLAASYDRLARYELAERAYTQARKLGGSTTVLLNNLGYHYLLRGDLKQARKYLTAAAQKEPENPQVQGNLRLLETWKPGDSEAIKAQNALASGENENPSDRTTRKLH